MALETCFRAWALHAPTTAGAKDRLPLVGSSSTSFAVPSSKRAAAVSVGRVAARRPRLVCQSKNAVDEVLVADDKSWDTVVLGCETPVLVEFWAPWCGPCRMIAPVIDELAKEYAGQIKCFKVNTDDCPNVASTYGIRSIPTVLIFKGGEKKETVIGAVPKSSLTNIIDKYVASS
ncbi:hypothetical protein U9M48_035241 [Paspalum notatum var. saurae]|uniref:Thioredoxin domain-containing protein n=1 Tax=Paspalum notatum var. saurae TaxID=547442 RepID=A0AAQ3X874_PASNO